MAREHVDHYIPLFGRDFLTATAGWTAAERGHYITLLIVQWEQGCVPAGLDRLELVSPGVTTVWPVLEAKFPVCDDGQRRNSRLEQHRERATELKAARSEAGQTGNRKRWSDRKAVANGSQTDRKPIANGVAKRSPPSPSPSPSSSLREEINTHTRGDGDDFRQPGWAATEWQRFVELWNATEKAQPWPGLMAPDGWVNNAAYPAWLEKAYQAMARLPQCQFFETPLAVTRFFTYVDRILAGEFDNAKQDRSRTRQPIGGNL